MKEYSQLEDVMGFPWAWAHVWRKKWPKYVQPTITKFWRRKHSPPHEGPKDIFEGGGNGFRCHCLRRIGNIVDFCLPKDFGPKMTTFTPAAPFSYFRCIKENLRISYWIFSQRKVTNAISLKKSDEDFLIAPSEDFEKRTFECVARGNVIFGDYMFI